MRTALAAPRPTEHLTRSHAAEVASDRREGQLTLTRRGRFILIGLPTLMVGLCVVALLMLFLSAGTASASPQSAGQGTQTVIVGSGETLWDIAAEVDPAADTRDIISQIDDMNDLSSGHVTPGQRLIVPVISGR
ncbi:LysM peptidoglycan-binding domain-containing protein [Kocuria massiliensis]|nr:LysM peptidoglycan-binding domain-containing protein [Kocuria massiliensis]